MMDINVENFLIELTALSKKHNIWIHGCGCCGSPYLTNNCDNYSSDVALIGEYLSCDENQHGKYTLTYNEK